MDTTNAHLHHAIPILRVEDIETSLAYYVEKLGFKLDWRTPVFLSVTRDKCSLMLCQGGQGRAGTWLWTAVKDADELHEELKARGAKILQGPANYEWGSREFMVMDPDSHVLRFASEATGEPDGVFPPDRTQA
jgi:uncharacterized glyoxalase superfamily protein PhnB